MTINGRAFCWWHFHISHCMDHWAMWMLLDLLWKIFLICVRLRSLTSINYSIEFWVVGRNTRHVLHKMIVSLYGHGPDFSEHTVASIDYDKNRRNKKTKRWNKFIMCDGALLIYYSHYIFCRFRTLRRISFECSQEWHNVFTTFYWIIKVAAI